MASSSSSSSNVPARRYKPSTAEGFTAGALAACTSVTFTNPLEVAKTRMQLDGELQAKPALAKAQAAAAAPVAPGGPARAADGRVYRNVFDALAKTWRFEGPRGAQRGLGAAYAYQVMLNGCRLGLYEPFRLRMNALSGHDGREQRLASNLIAGASSGIVGAVLGNPLFLIKARMQAYSPFNPVGAQHRYTSSFNALATIYRAEGAKGWIRGVDAAMLRTAMGSSVQLPSYQYAKNRLMTWGMRDGIETYLLASSFSGICVLLMMQPADTALTRMYNQSPNALGPDGKPRGLLYKNPIDCLLKTARTEGISGWYKGSLAHFLRIAPHTVITLVCNDLYMQRYIAFREARGGR